MSASLVQLKLKLHTFLPFSLLSRLAFFSSKRRVVRVMATTEITVLEHSRVSPADPSRSLNNMSFPLSYFDIAWVPTHPLHQLFFYELAHTKSHLLHTIIPNLKHSLSITLQHFFPLAGNLKLFPFTDHPTCVPKTPEISFVVGDSVSFTVAESSMDFVSLTKNHTRRKANEVYPLVPKLGDLTRNDHDNPIQVPLFALQVTLFPNHGICIGITSHHVAGDAISSLNFLGAWSSVTKFGYDKAFFSNGPFLDRSIINDPNGKAAKIWSHIAKTWFQQTPPTHISGNDDMVRASFIMTKEQINNLKKSILAHRPTIARVSSFTIVCAHFWICMAKARKAIGELDKQELVFGCIAECRARLNPPLPTNYFGNCVVSLQAYAKHDQLVGEGGFFDAIELIGDAIKERLTSSESIDAGIDALVQEFRGFPMTVAGSPKFDFYDIDFGWGKPKKNQMVSIDYGQAIFLSPSRESEQDVGIELSLPQIQMDALETIFTNELKKIISRL